MARLLEEWSLFVLAHAAAAVECRFQSGITVSTMDNAEQMEIRFVDIEIKLAQQEDLVESLNQMVYQQGKRIDQLEAMLHKLGEHVRDGAQQANGGLVNERPPHY